MPSKGQTLKCLPDLRGLKDKDAQHCMNNPIYNTKKKNAAAKSLQFSHRQHDYDYKNIAWNIGISPRSSWFCTKKVVSFCTKAVH